jgi:cytochrome oxidase assembly protein ShyY1
VVALIDSLEIVVDVKKFGEMVAALGGFFGLIAAYYAIKPKTMDKAYVKALQEAIALGGYSDKLADIHMQFEHFEQMSIWFGIAAAVTIFIGVALRLSAKKQAD